MTRNEWLNKKHRELDKQITAMEAERSLIRNADHKILLASLKKQRLAIKSELALEHVT